MKEYRIAGELFAYLRQELGFGELTMATRKDISVSFRWEFNAKGKRWAQEQAVLLDELALLDSTEEFAKHLASEWKRNYNRSDTQS